MINIDITKEIEDKVVITMTKRQAELLRDLVGKVGGGYRSRLTINSPEILDGKLVQELVTSPLYKQLSSSLDE